MKITVLSIDAWNDGDNMWSWNSWYKVGSIDSEEFDALERKGPGALMKWLRDEGIGGPGLNGRTCYIEDDQYNLVVTVKKTNEPIFAFAYGEAI